MGTNKSSEPSTFGLAVRAEILAEMGRREIGVGQLVDLVPRGKTYLYDRLSKAEKELALSDIESICEALSVQIAPLMERAELAVLAAEREAYQKHQQSYFGVQDGYTLAAKEVHTGEGEDGVEYYEG